MFMLFGEVTSNVEVKKMRTKNVNRRTIEIYKEDWDALNSMRTTDIGKVSYADIVHNVIKKIKEQKKSEV
jgi:hypothetical protein